MWIALFFACSLGAYGYLNVFLHIWVRSEMAGLLGLSNNREESDNASKHTTSASHLVRYLSDNRIVSDIRIAFGAVLVG